MDRRRRTRLVALVMAVLLVIPLLAGLLAVTTSGDDSTSPSTASTSGTLPRVTDLPTVTVEELPPEARDTLALILAGGPFPYERDGAVFQNREGLLPEQPAGFYLEYTVPTPGEDDRGARRFVVGGSSQFFYTDDHYESFRELTVG